MFNFVWWLNVCLCTAVQTKLILDHGSASIRAVFADERNTCLSDEALAINKEKCREYEVTVKVSCLCKVSLTMFVMLNCCQ